MQKMIDHVFYLFSPSEGACSRAENNLCKCFTSNVNSVTLEQELSVPSDPPLKIDITEDNHNRRPDSFTS